jgi:hypothetical protein
LTFLLRRYVVEAWEHPTEDVEARPLAPAVGLTRALGHTGTFQGERDETGNDVAHHQQLEEFHAPRILLSGHAASSLPTSREPGTDRVLAKSAADDHERDAPAFLHWDASERTCRSRS